MNLHSTKFVCNYIKQITISIIITQQILHCQTFSTNQSNWDTLFNTSITLQNGSKSNFKHVSFSGEEIHAIRKQFDGINEDFNALQDIFSFTYPECNLRIIRSLDVRPKCTISKTKLTNLKNEVENLYSHSSNYNRNLCTQQNLNDTENCNELIKIIQCGFLHFKQGFEIAIKLKNSSIDEIMKWKNAYHSLSDKYIKQSESLKQALSQENQLKLDKLQTDIQNLGKILNIAMERFQTATFNLCVSEIKLGEIQEAIQNFKDLKSISISLIINKCYNFQNVNDELKHFENIINFIKHQPNQSDEKTGYETLYKEMETKNDLKTLKVILLAKNIENSTVKNELTIENICLKVKHIYLNKIQDLWTNAILYNSKDAELINFAKNYHVYFDKILSETLIKAIKSKYNALTDKFENVVRFIKDLPHFHQTAIAYKTFFNELKRQDLLTNNDRIIKFAYHIKKVMNMQVYSNANIEYQSMIEGIKRDLPTSARDLIWDGYACQLENRMSGQYLYADENMSRNNKLRRTILTQDLDNIIQQESLWIFRTDDGGDSFTIMNFYRGEYLYAAADDLNYGKHRRSVFTWKPGDRVPEGSWKIKLRGDYITLQNTYYYNEYLYSFQYRLGGYRNRIYRVLTWGLGEYDLSIESDWKLRC
ncbi:uncharacterized protein LOC123297257 [Chrysoperla carnea]|uniref:uncharacterized protein LOC123297257 n=1 Tax=Chrysoperla carnea TaxID=189513 RepID=UPI001D08D25F|nr:uncharacterized protein LOC123297257 [Chrysoperla carnea]